MVTILQFLYFLVTFTLFASFVILAFMSFAPIFGGRPDNHSEQKICCSPNRDNKQKIFVNKLPTVLTASKKGTGLAPMLKNFLFPAKGKNPVKPLPAYKFDKNQVQNATFTWFGHSTVLFRTANKTIITDPVFYRASPVFIGGKAFKFEHKTKIRDLPDIDIVVISHDHYDHLDYYAIKKLNKKVKQFFVPLGVKAHLQKWGVSNDKIKEFDWDEEAQIDEVKITFTPSRHFSGRGLFNTFSTLWGSWVIQSPELNVFFSGDGGYWPEFKKLGERFGGFDIAFMENGAYGEQWPEVHMMPEDSVRASLDINAKRVLPIHWSKFDLSNHKWNQPIERFLKASADTDLKVATPLIYQTFNLRNLPTSVWWHKLSDTEENMSLGIKDGLL